MADTQKSTQADAAEKTQGTPKAVPWTDVDRAILLNNIIMQLHAASGKTLDWKIISEALPGRTMAAMRAVWDRYKNDMNTAAAGEGEFVAVPNKQKTPRKKANPKAVAATTADDTAGADADAEDAPETPAKKRGAGGRKRATEADGEEGSATKKKRTPKKPAVKKTTLTPAKLEEDNSDEAASPLAATENGNGDADLEEANE
ncbi:hypothetical protein ACHAQH_006055 [Verticillium albo-atrum]